MILIEITLNMQGNLERIPVLTSEPIENSLPIG